MVCIRRASHLETLFNFLKHLQNLQVQGFGIKTIGHGHLHFDSWIAPKSGIYFTSIDTPLCFWYSVWLKTYFASGSFSMWRLVTLALPGRSENFCLFFCFCNSKRVLHVLTGWVGFYKLPFTIFEAIMNSLSFQYLKRAPIAWLMYFVIHFSNLFYNFIGALSFRQKRTFSQDFFGDTSCRDHVKKHLCNTFRCRFFL